TEEEVRRRTVRNSRARLVTAAKLMLRKPDAVPVDRASTQQPMVVVDVEIVFALGVELANPLYFAPVLGDMRLDEAVGMFLPECAGGLELRRAAGDREPRRDGIHESAPPMPALDQRLRQIVAASSRVEQSSR